MLFLALQCVILTSLLHLSASGGISDFRLCADPLCEEKISIGRTTQNYASIHKNVLQFKTDEVATIYSKEAGNNTDLWGVEINGKRGYAHKKFIKEEKVYVRNLKYKVETNLNSLAKDILNITSKENVKDLNEKPLEDSLEEIIVNKPSSAEVVKENVIETPSVKQPILPISGEDIEFDSVGYLADKAEESKEKESSRFENNVNEITEEGMVQEAPTEVDAPEKNEAERMDFKEDSESVKNFQELNVEGKDVEIDSDVKRMARQEKNDDERAKESSHYENPNYEENLNDKNSEHINTIEKDNDEGNGNEGEENGNEYIAKEDIIGDETINSDVKPSDALEPSMEHKGSSPGTLDDSFPKTDAVLPSPLKQGKDTSESSSQVEIPVAEPPSQVEIPVAEPSYQAKIPVAEPSSQVEISVAEPSSQAEIPVAEPPSQAGIPVAEPSSQAEIPVAEPPSQAEIPVAEPSSLVEIPVAEPSSQAEISVAEPPSQAEIPAAEPPSQAEIPAAEPPSQAEIPVAEPSPQVEIPVTESPPTSSEPHDSNTNAQPTAPTPSRPFEVVDGTTIYGEPEDQSYYDSATSSLPFQGSHASNRESSSEPTPSFHKPEKMAITEMPMVLKKKTINDNGNANAILSKSPEVKVSSEMDHSLNPSSDDLTNHLADAKKNIHKVDAATLPKDHSSLPKESHTDMVMSDHSSIPIESDDDNVNMLLPHKDDSLTSSKLDGHDMPMQTEDIVSQTEFQTANTDTVLENTQQLDDSNISDQPSEKGGILSSLSSSIFSSDPNPKDKNEEDDNQSATWDSNSKEGQRTEHESDKELNERAKRADNIKEPDTHSGELGKSIEGDEVHILKDADEANGDKPLEPLIANLHFLDPDATQSVDHKDSGNKDSLEESVDHSQTPPERREAEQLSDSAMEDKVDEEHLNSEQDNNLPSLKERILDASEPLLSEGMSLALEGELADPHMSTGTLIFLLVASGTIVLLYLSHMLMVKISRESPLIEMMNELDRVKRILLEENNNLKKQLAHSGSQMNATNYSDPVELQKATEELHVVEKEVIELREKNQQLENDLESSTANEVELHRMLNELLSSQKETSSFEESVNSLQVMLDGQREVVENLTSDLALKTRLNDELRNELKESKSKNNKLEYQIEQLAQSLEDVNSSKQEYLQKLTKEESSLISLKEMNESLRQEVDKAAQVSNSYYQESLRLSGQLRNLRQNLNSKEAECQVAKECLKKLQILSEGGNDVGGKLSEIFGIIEVRSQLLSSEKQCSTLSAELEEREKTQTMLNERVNNMENDLAQLKESTNALQKERDDAKSKLGVLTQYYEEKEEQLKKALQSQEGLLQNAEGSAAVVNNRIQTYEIELASCRSQLESLKNELEEQKQSHKIQLTNEEKKLHEHWLAARSAERRQEELRQENSQLRQKLTQVHSEQNFIKSKRVDANGSVSSPVPMENNLDSMHPSLDLEGPLPPPPLPPPPMMSHMFGGRPPIPPGLPPGLPPMHPHMFGPLPPPPMPDRRLPPAGRIASPPGYDRRSYSPGSDHSHYSDQRYSPTGPPRYSPGGNHRSHPSDHKSDHHPRRNTRRNPRSPSPLDGQRHSPERWYTQSPKDFSKHRRSSPSLDYYEDVNDRRILNYPSKGKKTSTPLGPNDR